MPQRQPWLSEGTPPSSTQRKAETPPDAAATIENLRSGNEELCGLLIRRDETIAELSEDNVRLQAHCTQLMADWRADQSLMSALESRAVQAEARSNALRIETGQLRQELLVSQHAAAVSVRKLQLSRLLRSFNAWTGSVEDAAAMRSLATKVIKRIRSLALAAALSSWRNATVDRVATKQLLRKVVQRIRNLALSRTMLQWHGAVKYVARIRAVAQQAVSVWYRRAMAWSFGSWLLWCEHAVATKQLLRKVVQRIRNLALSRTMLQWHGAVKYVARIRAVAQQAVSVWYRRAMAWSFGSWLLWCEHAVATRKLAVKLVKRIRSLALAASLSSWREVTVDRVATKQLLRKVVRRMQAIAMSKAFDCWALWQEAQVRSREVQRMSEQAARVKQLTASQRKADKQKMMLVVQKLRLRTLARAMSAWRGHTVHAQVTAANSKLLEGLHEAQGALLNGLAEAEAEVKSASAILHGEKIELESVLDDIVVENRTVTARCTELASTQVRLESTTEELETRAAAAEKSSASLADEIDALRDANAELDRALEESNRQNASLSVDRNELAEVNAGLQKSVAEAERQLAVVSKEMSSVRDELAVSRLQQQEMLMAVKKLNEELDASHARERVSWEETARLRSEVMSIAELLKAKSIHIESAERS